ncbi:MAG TPA: DUF58 domain-containing protein [Candidatus Anaerostipes excrementavium]|uniref:DUF58 domain-containing protein n=1 Tax=Candidatus Anaerostipes excrementavium TaxID=2838463 RepID=A0A9D2BA54_9FIRM|nr:DUF58 domain-containing protein [uncultured Anaerostipes sp.]HIX67859.1 DUF58 domain-containing protein [Candidatus Anaerostipes excrementavium]
MRKGIYLSFSLLTFYLAGLYRLDVLVFLFAAEILLFVWSRFLPAYFAGNLEFWIALGETQGEAKKKEPIHGKIMIKNQGMLPITLFTIVLKYENLNDQKGTKNVPISLKGYVSAKGTTEIPFSISSQYCGVLRFWLCEMKVFDYLRLFSKRQALEVWDSQIVLPQGGRIDLKNLEDHKIEETFWGPADVLREASPPDVDDVREYRQGDGMRDIHWKLSARNDELYSKIYRDEMSRQASLFLDLKQEREMTIEEKDAYYEIVCSIAEAFLRQDIRLRVWWYDAKENAMVIMQVNDRMELQKMLEELVGRAVFYFGDEAKEAIWLYQKQLGGTIHLSFNTKLQLKSQTEVLASFTKDLERRWISV